MKKKKGRKDPDPKRVEALRNMPSKIIKRLSKEDVNAFLFDDRWPDSLKEKLKDYLVEVC